MYIHVNAALEISMTTPDRHPKSLVTDATGEKRGVLWLTNCYVPQFVMSSDRWRV